MFFRNCSTGLGKWTMSWLAFNNGTLTLMVTFLVRLSGLDTCIWIAEESRGLGAGRGGGLIVMKSCEATIIYSTISTKSAWELAHGLLPKHHVIKSLKLPASNNLFWADNASTVTLVSWGTVGPLLCFCPFYTLYHFIKGLWLVRLSNSRSRGFVLHPARGSDISFHPIQCSPFLQQK